MKQRLKQVLAAVLIMSLAFGVALVAPGITAQAASKKLTKADFKFKGKYKSILNEVIETPKQWGWAYSNIIDEKNPKKCIKTNRGITLTSTKKQVFKKYGKVSLKKLDTKSKLYKRMKKSDVDYDGLKLFKNSKCAAYTYKSGSNTYQLYFFFDEDNKVNCILACKNCS